MAAETDSRCVIAIMLVIAVPATRPFAFPRRPRRIAGGAFHGFFA